MKNPRIAKKIVSKKKRNDNMETKITLIQTRDLNGQFKETKKIYRKYK